MRKIGQWWLTLLDSCSMQMRLVVKDAGVMLFFLALPLAYPIVYTLIYNPEVVREIPVAIVDKSGTGDSRHLSRMIDATEYAKVVGYASSLGEARQWAMERKVYAIVEIPADYARRIGRHEQAVVPVYCDMGLMIRYRNMLFSLTDVTLQLGAELRTQTIDNINGAWLVSGAAQTGVSTESFMLGNPTQGFASFIIPGLVILILQQSLILGVLMLGGGSNERRRRNHGVDPLAVAGPTTASLLGKALCLVVIYAPLTVYILHYVPQMFHLPMFGSPWQYLPLALPFLLSSAFLGMCLQPLVSERESSFVVFVFTSVLFLFLSGLTWPRSAMSPLWGAVASLLPASWGMQGFIGISSNSAVLATESVPYIHLWGLTAIYFVVAVAIEKLRKR
ncbi:MAG: ABC transporter permease [Muribaculum sp.]|nr:ABC transporter permease [Muribaculaceae bacterium]MCM1081798.1 ABC transporter permease [Muribaculum sp.]